MSKPFHSGGLRGAAKVGAKKGEELKEIYRKAKSAPVPSKQSELLEAARKAADEIEENLEQEGRHAGLKSAAQTLRTAIRNYEQGGECAHE